MSEMILSDMEEIKINTDVLVVGGGYTGLKAAKGISDSGYSVVLIESDTIIGGEKNPLSLIGIDVTAQDELKRLVDDVAADDAVNVLMNTRLVSAAGAPGDFTIRLATSDGDLEKKIGAIVVATNFSNKPLYGEYGLSLSDSVLTLSQLEYLLSGSDREQLSNKTIAFMVGFAQEGNSLVMERILSNVLAVESIGGCTTYVFAGNLKVASDGLERAYLESRDKGATYFKLQTMPTISPDGKSIFFIDPVLRKKMELSPDVIVIEEEILADEMNTLLAEILRIDVGPCGFLQIDNIHRFPVQSNREGIFVIGGTRDVQNIPTALMDVENAVLEINHLLKDGKIVVPKNKAVLDIGKCTFCITCYRVCPHGAIYWDNTNKPVISPVACQGCGICASECPMDAIQIGDYSDAEIMDKIKSNGSAATDDLRIVAFCCQNSAYEAGLMADAFQMETPANLQVIKVPCAGKVDLDYIMKAFVEGADGVLVMACHPGNCKSEKGNTYAEWRVVDAHRMMEETGLEKERLGFVTLASNMGTGFSSAVMDLENRLKELGTSPFNK